MSHTFYMHSDIAETDYTYAKFDKASLKIFQKDDFYKFIRKNHSITYQHLDEIHPIVEIDPSEEDSNDLIFLIGDFDSTVSSYCADGEKNNLQGSEKGIRETRD